MSDTQTTPTTTEQPTEQATAPADIATAQPDATPPAAEPSAPAAEPPAADSFAPKSEAHASLLNRVEGFGEHLAHVLAQDFAHIEADAKDEVLRLWKQVRQLLRGHGVTPTP